MACLRSVVLALWMSVCLFVCLCVSMYVCIPQPLSLSLSISPLSLFALPSLPLPYLRFPCHRHIARARLLVSNAEQIQLSSRIDFDWTVETG